MTVVLILGLLLNAIALPIAGRRVVFLYRLITSGQPAPDRVVGVTSKLGAAAKRQVVEVFGQRKLLKWSVPGAAHFFVFWAFVILGTVYLEAYVILLTRNPEWSWFVFGSWSVLGFVQDFIAVMALAGIAVFWAIRLRNQPKQLGRQSRFFGSHLGPAYFTLFMIFNVVWTLFLFRGAVEARDMALSASGGGDHGYGKAAFVSHLLGKALPDSTALIGIGLILHIGVMLAFLVFVLNSKHLHIFVAPLNVLFGRRPVALGAVKPLISHGKPVTLDDIDDLDDDATLGVGSITDFTWKGLLDFETCTECGRCQSQCPAWNTEKPLSPKLLIMNLRDHALAAAPAILAGDSGKAPEAAVKELERPLVGPEIMEGSAYGVIDPDVLWSCTTCGACVNQCPVDIEHVDHIVDMRRYQVLVESNFPSELNQLFRGLESKGNPWNMSAQARMDWAKGLDFEVPVVGETLESLESVDWLFWVGCAGAYEDRAKKTTRAVAELLNLAGVSFGVLGNGETCTGDPARRAGNEFVYQGLAAQNVETFQTHQVKQVVTTCAHCFNTLKNEYSDFGLELEVVHHTQLLNRLVREGRLTPVSSGEGATKRTITYHDPCYLGRHNQVYAPPRELLQVLPGASFVEMERSAERSFCCGAGGARMWMEENIGERINTNRTKEAVGTGADQIAVGCPFCRVMLSDGLTAEQASGGAREEVEVLDVAQMLLASVKGESATRSAAPAAPAPAAPSARSEETRAEPEPGDDTQTDETVTETAEVGAAAQASGGSSLFDVEEDTDSEPPSPAPVETPAATGSLFDVEEDEPEPAKTDPAEPAPSTSGSLFDVEPDDQPEPTKAESAAPAEPAPSTSGSLFDVEPDDQPEPTKAGPVPPASTDTTTYTGSLFDLDEDDDEVAAADRGESPAPGADKAPQSDQIEEAATDDVPVSDKKTPPPEPKKDVDLDEGGSLFDL
ncbi:MAG TPA: heterodisulfide reductase-related iron-sulfur binding cluster [Nocardioides sp.]|nr:heterodisulfide reductase-related iron-sulfur binding cluster [Nocardioides sp.]